MDGGTGNTGIPLGAIEFHRPAMRDTYRIAEHKAFAIFI
jgi:hypothetical protein